MKGTRSRFRATGLSVVLSLVFGFLLGANYLEYSALRKIAMFEGATLHQAQESYQLGCLAGGGRRSCRLRAVRHRTELQEIYQKIDELSAVTP